MRRVCFLLPLAVGIAIVAGGAGLAEQEQQPPSAPPATPAGQPATPAGQAGDQQPPAPRPAEKPPQPTFRVGATFVRVDAFVTQNGEPVGDLKPEEFEIREDNVPQAIRTFEYVNIPPATVQTAARRDPNTVRESREAAADPRRRVFVLFLDTYHVTQGAGMWSRTAMFQFLVRMIGPDDLIAGMTPEMAPGALSFGSRTESLESMLNGIYGRRDSIVKDEEEERLQYCFTPEEWPVMRDRRRAKLTLDALEGLVHHLGGLREERKAIIAVTEGWLVYRDNIDISKRPDGRVPSGPEIAVGPGGKLGTVDQRNIHGLTPGFCDNVRMQFATMETRQQLRDLPDVANRANASFYTVDPRGLAVFDSAMGPDKPPPIDIDRQILRTKLDQLRELSDRTDGLAVQNTNDLHGALARIAGDLSAYYLIGYDSTNPKLDGTYRDIKVQVKRPGVVVRARRGYRAAVDGRGGPSPVEATSSGAGTNSGVDVAGAVSALTATRADLPIRLRIATIRLPAAAAAPATDASQAGTAQSGEVRELRVLAELDAKVAANSVWQQGGTARIVVRGPDGESATSLEAPLGVGERAVAATVPLPASLAPGEYRVQVRVTNASKIDSVGDSVAITIPARATTIGEASVLRRGPSTGVKYMPTADLRFRRQERLRLEAPFVIPLSRVRAALVDQSGRSMSLPVTIAERGEGTARLLVVDVSLAPLAAGGYAVMVSDTAETTSRILVPLQVIP
jgi:VWFA-related protein